MTDQNAISTMREVLAAWQRTGSPVALRPYVKALAACGHTHPYRTLRGFCRAHRIPLDDTFLGVALAVLAGEATAAEQAIRFLLLPLLRRRFRTCDPRGAVEATRAWLKNVGIPLRPSHIRILAHQVLGHTRLRPRQIAALLRLYARCGAPWQSPGRKSVVRVLAGHRRTRLAAFVTDALRFWDSQELPAALLAHLTPTVKTRNAHGALHWLRATRCVMSCAGPASPHGLETLPRVFATIVAAANPEEPASSSFAARMLGSFERLCEVLGLAGTLEVRNWYASAADLVDTQFTSDQSPLRAAWAQDLANWLHNTAHVPRPATFCPAGRRLLPILCERWFDLPIADLPTERLVELLAQLPVSSRIELKEVVWPKLEQVIRSGSAFADCLRRYLYVLRMLPADPPQRIAALLLARSPRTRDVNQACIDALLAFAKSPERLHGAAARVIESVQTSPWPVRRRAFVLLLETMFSPRGRWPSLACRIHREIELAALEGGATSILAIGAWAELAKLAKPKEVDR